MEVKVTSENFETYKNGAQPFVMDLWATWCGPCRMLGPVISELANDYDGVRSIPTVLFFKNGQLVDKFVGAAPKEVLDAKFKALL